MTSRNLFSPLAALAAISILISGCALPPIITAASLGADFISLSSSGKSVTDHGISMVMQQDCSMFGVFDDGICHEYGPDEDTPDGALVTLVALSDPEMNPGGTDSMVVPGNLAYLQSALGTTVASTTEQARTLPVVAFAGESGPRTQAAFGDDFAYLVARIDG